MSDFHIAVIDDDASVRHSLGAFLNSDGRIVSKHADGASFISSIAEHSPDLAFLDLMMPGLSGLDVLKRLAPPSFPVVMISAHGDIAAAVQAIKLGAVDFIEKPFTPDTIESILTDVQKHTQKPPTAHNDALAVLTDREREIAYALGEGLTNKEVAHRLHISPRTVEVHRARIFQKTGVRNLAGLVHLLA